MTQPFDPYCKANPAVFGTSVVAGMLLLGLVMSVPGRSEEGALSRTGAVESGPPLSLVPGQLPPRAVAPFSAVEAREHQQCWAKHLGVPVEHTNSLGMRLVLIPPGEFEMGAGEEEIQRACGEINAIGCAWVRPLVRSEGPRHRVRITRPLFIGTCEVTVAQFRRFVKATAYQTDAERDAHGIRSSGGGDRKGPAEINWHRPGVVQSEDGPVTQITWDDAMAFCGWLSRQENVSYRVPTEAEWEYACRAGTDTRWNLGDQLQGLPEAAWYADNSGGHAHPVGQKKPNAWGLYDLHGNASEWCADWMAKDYYRVSPTDDPCGPPAGYWRVYRGGAWDSAAVFTRSTYRIGIAPDIHNDALGFRVVCEVSGNQGAPASLTASSRPGFPRPDSPPVAAAPFSVADARHHQERWAVYLKMPVEESNSIGMALRLIPPGEFDMGATQQEIDLVLRRAKEANEPEWYFARVSTELPRHRVKITRPFYLGTYEVTQKEYDRVMGSDRRVNNSQGIGQVADRWPAQFASWHDTVDFCRRLSDLPAERAAGRTYRLPTEAEWEYACRAGSTTQFSFGDAWDAIGEYGWFRENASSGPQTVGQKKPNAWGLYDMHGNLWEWCSDRWANDYYQRSPVENPLGPSVGEEYVCRGGAYVCGPYFCRNASRLYLNPKIRSEVRGFRVVCQRNELERSQ